MKAYRILVGNPDGQKTLGRGSRCWMDIIKIYPREIGCCDMEWISLVRDGDEDRALMNALMNLSCR
jgi:hypothetical protein